MFLKSYIDQRYKPQTSLALRYYKGAPFGSLSRKDFQAVSLKEGSRILKLFDYKKAPVYIADESTLMASGTYKALEACFTIAFCLKNGHKRIAFSSGANMGSALAVYGQKAGIETFFFHPKPTGRKLDAHLFRSALSHLISVDKHEKEVKRAALLFARMSGMRHVPDLECRLSATGLRAFFVFEYMIRHNIKFNWISQAICAGYGPLGFYKAAKKLILEGAIDKNIAPRFLGIQQEALSPMANAWQNKHAQIMPADIVAARPAPLLSPTLYNTNPGDSYRMLYQCLVDFGGNLASLSRQEYRRYFPLLLRQLSRKGIKITKRRTSGGRTEILENAGLLGLAGALKAIDEGIIKEGEAVLSFFTGGAGNYSGKQAIPEYEIRRQDNLEESLENYLKHYQKL